jgi:hypothetical protein
VVLLADVGIIDVADLVVRIESDQQIAVGNRNVSRHVGSPARDPANSRIIRSAVGGCNGASDTKFFDAENAENAENDGQEV